MSEEELLVKEEEEAFGLDDEEEEGDFDFSQVVSSPVWTNFTKHSQNVQNGSKNIPKKSKMAYDAISH